LAAAAAKHQQVCAQRVADASKTVSIYWPWIDSGISHAYDVINVNYLCIRSGRVTPDTETFTVKKITTGTPNNYTSHALVLIYIWYNTIICKWICICAPIIECAKKKQPTVPSANILFH